VAGVRVGATGVAHVGGKKLRVFKDKAKKRTGKMAGYRSDLTELRVESILAKGAALPARARWRESKLRPIAAKLGERRARLGYERAVRGFEAIVTGRAEDPRAVVEMLAAIAHER